MKPFHKATIPPREVETVIAAARREMAADPLAYRARWGFDANTPSEEILGHIRSLANEGDVYLNDVYQVNTRIVPPIAGSNWPALIHLSIKRIDRAPIHDWRELQEIKNLLVGPEHEAMELYPAESRVVDTANQYHLWVIAQAGLTLPFGFMTGIKSEGPMGKSQQRPFRSGAT